MACLHAATGPCWSPLVTVIIGYFCAYGLNVDCVGIEWGTAVSMTANTCQNAGSGRTQSGME